MPEEWTGEIVKRLHLSKISQRELADEMGVSFGYVSMLLSGAKHAKDAPARMGEAIDAIIQRRSADS